EFYSGGPNHRDNRTLFQQKHLSRIEREFAISATEATVRQFEKFLSETDHYYESGRALGVSEDAPQTLVKWYSAAAFCNWLSEREGIPKSQWCFAPDQAGVFGVGARTQLDVLDRTGYRMPTELEWQYACMADTATNWSFGNDIEATSQFAWHAANSEGRFHAVARLLPNEFGLFDMHGNVREFCLNLVETNRGALVSSRLASDRTYVFPTTATLSASDPSRLASVALRGGTSLNSPEYLRTASWMPLSVNSAGMSTGFRVARTLKSNPRHQPGYGFTEGLRLEQAGQHVRTPHLDLHEHEAFTIEGWVRDWKGPLVSIGSSRSTPRITLAHVKATMQGPGIEPTALVFGDAIPFGLHHRAFVVDGNSRRFYVDGQLVAEATADGVPNIPDQRPMLIGQMEGQSIAFSIGEVFLIEVSSVARYDTSFEPKPRRNADEHTLRLYDFEAISGDHVPDLSAAKAHGKLIRP
ncbi:MAG: SUMF1/EgtB/PvdO family nonheme iron enzyme, partial [Planctomycetota bacterium]